MDKACGEGLMPDSIWALRELGIEIPAEVGFAFHGIRFTDGRSSVFADFPNGIVRGVRRTILHELLIRHTISQGVSILWGARQVRLAKDGVSVNGGFIAADLVVGADGQNSYIRRQASLHQIKREKRRYGFRRHYRIAPWSSYMELHWGPRHSSTRIRVCRSGSAGCPPPAFVISACLFRYRGVELSRRMLLNEAPEMLEVLSFLRV